MKAISGIKILVGVSLIFIAWRYRIRQYNIIPKVDSTFDEQAYLWAGESLLQSGVPIGWSILDLYFEPPYSLPGESEISLSGYTLTVNGQPRTLANWRQWPQTLATKQEVDIDGYKSQFKIIQPFLENPPLTGLLLAVVHTGDQLLSTSVKQIRLVPITFTSLTAGGVYWLAYLLGGLGPGLIAGLIYALSPGMVVSGRLAIPENLIASLLVFTLIALYYYLKRPRRLLLWLLLIPAFLAPLLKISGLIIPGTVSVILFRQKKFRPAIYVVISSLLGIITYFAYGLFYDAQVFIAILQAQGQRKFLGPMSLAVKALFPQIPLPMYEGWILLGYLSILWLIGRRIKNAHLIITGVIIHWIFFGLYGGSFPWYQFIAFPLLAVAGGLTLNHFFRKPQIYFNIFVFIITFSTLMHYAYLRSGLQWNDLINQYRLFIGILIIIPLVAWIFRKGSRLLTQLSLSVILLSSFYFSIQIINRMQELWVILENLPYPLTWVP